MSTSEAVYEIAELLYENLGDEYSFAECINHARDVEEVNHAQ